LYLIVNKPNKKIYLGGCADLAQRKGEHSLSLRNPERASTKLATAMRGDLNKGSNKDFYFVPLIIISRADIKGLVLDDTNTDTVNQQVSKFLDTFVEKALLEFFLESPLSSAFYNVKMVGIFEKGNTFGGSPQSGEPPSPIAFNNFAWESVSAVANTFAVDRKLIRTKRENGIMRPLTIEEYQSFSGIKIANSQARNFSQEQPTMYKELLVLLFPTVAKKRASNGEP
jgi:hypothetical protein